MLKAKNIMTAEVTIIQASAIVTDAMERTKSNSFRGLIAMLGDCAYMNIYSVTNSI